MNKLSITGRLLAVAAAGLFIAGCATTEDVERAQATADSAMAGAHQAGQTASAAQDTANTNKAAIAEMDPKLDHLYDVHHGPRG